MSASGEILHSVIVAAGPEHLPAIAALAEVVWRAHYPGIISHGQIDYMLARMYDLDVMRQELERGIRYDRLLLNDVLLGFASSGPAENARKLKLHKLYVHPDWQRRGLGSALLLHVEKMAHQQGFRAIFLTVNKANHKAIAAYRKSGFVIRESVVVDIGGGFVMNDYVMEKALPAANHPKDILKNKPGK